MLYAQDTIANRDKYPPWNIIFFQSEYINKRLLTNGQNFYFRKNLLQYMDKKGGTNMENLEIDLDIFVQKLRTLMDAHAQTAFDLSRSINVSQGTISRYLAKTRVPDINVLYKIAKYYGVSIDWLLGMSDGMHDKYSPNVRKFADLYTLSTDQDKMVVDAILSKYEGIHKDYLDMQTFVDEFCEIGKYNPNDINRVIQSISNIPGITTRMTNAEISFRFSQDIWADAALLALNIQFNRAVMYFAPKRIQTYITAHDMFPKEINELLEGYRPFINENLGKAKPYENLSFFYYLDIHKVIENLPELCTVIASFVQTVKEASE